MTYSQALQPSCRSFELGRHHTSSRGRLGACPARYTVWRRRAGIMMRLLQRGASHGYRSVRQLQQRRNAWWWSGATDNVVHFNLLLFTIRTTEGAVRQWSRFLLYGGAGLGVFVLTTQDINRVSRDPQ